MTKLKTLKDLLNIEEISKGDVKIDVRDVFNSTLVRKEDVKAEAVKWHKVRMKEAIPLYHRDWEEFFNITSEDLK